MGRTRPAGRSHLPNATSTTNTFLLKAGDRSSAWRFDMEFWIILGSVIVVAVILGAIFDRRVRRRGAQVNTEPDRHPSGPYDFLPW
jgi:hypothetical protein